MPAPSRGTKINPELEDLADQIGEFIAYWGFKRVHGRIWTHIFLSASPLDASDIIERLGISKALVSISLKDLLDYEVIRDAGRSERGTVLYEANENVTDVITNVLRRREKRMMSRIQTAQRLLKELPAAEKRSAGLNDAKLADLAKMIDFANDSLDHVLALDAVDLTAMKSFLG
jgi:DNA-binding transcriptional regulator GbsR (MarR family)